MERLTEYDYEQVVLKGLNIVGIGESNADILEAGVRKLANYEDTGLTPEEINNDIRVHTELWEERLNEAQSEWDKWHKEAMKYIKQLLMIQKWFESLGTTMEKVLEDCKTISPSTTDAP